MFSGLFHCLLVLVVCACSPSAAKHNGTMRGRTFIVFDNSVTDEPIDWNSVNEEEDNNELNGTSGRTHNIIRPEISEEVLLFLSGPVSTILIPSFYTLVFIISVPVNFCALLAFAHKIRPKKPAAIYMLNLACADLLFGMLLPFKISYHFRGNNWIFGSVMCRVVTAVFYWNMYCSVLLIACISVDRLLAVVYPIHSLTWRTPRKTVIACVAMWIISLAGSVPLVVSNQTVQIRTLNITTCHDVQSISKILHYKIYFITLCCALFFLPLLVTVVSYTRVIWSLGRVPDGFPGRSHKRTRAVVMAGTVLVIFVLCFMPTNCLMLAHYLQFQGGTKNNLETPDGSYTAYLVFLCLGSLNCLLDPLVYYFGSSQCQRQVSSALRCQKTTKRRSISHSSSDSCRSSSRAILKTSCTESSKIDTPLAKIDPFQADLNSQYKKLLV
ncbi:proteinase-activated receptor 1-like [Mastacembelus armatus]|uniref:Proteinase-activated receptor 1 n=1 Tax=Mastacembelus armatus TaxID=205130 RepID=A0A7N8YJU3_9TELE|nr:proteinase-activated receptor 1-like [Mastacembelus armatus]